MKKIMNRALSLILTAAMILSLSQNAFPGNGTVFMPGVYAAQNTTSGQAGALLKTSDSAQKAAVSDETSIDVIEEDIDQDTVEEQAALEAAEDILEDEIPESKSVKKEEQDSRTDKSGKKGQSDISDKTKKAGKADASQEADRSEKTGGSNKNGKAGKSAGSGKSDESGSSSSKSSSKSNASSSKNEEYDGDVVLETEDSHGKDEEDFSDDGEIIDSEEESSDSGKESAEAGLKNSGAGDTEQKAESGDEDSEDKEKSAGSGDEGSEEKEQSAGSGDEDSEEKEQSAGSGDEDSEEKEQSAGSGDEDSEEKEQKAGSGAGNSEDTGDSGDGKESADSKEGAENSGGSGEGASEGGKSSEDKKETEGAEIVEDDDEKDAGSGSGTAEDNDGGDDHSGKTEHSDSTEKGNTEKKDTEKKDTENTDKKGTEGSKKEEIEEDSGSESTAPADRDGGKASQNPAEGDTSAITEDSTGVTAGDEAAASAKEADVELRSITAEVVEIDPYARGGENGGINENDGGNAETFARAESFWQALFDRAPVPSADREGYEKLDKKDLTVQISGMLPEGVTAVVYAVPFTEDATWSETALMALDVVLYDRDGNLYVPKTGLELIFGGNIIKKTVKAQMPVLIYNFEENEKRAEKKKTYAADAAVYRDGTSYDDRLRYRTDGKKDSGKAKWTKGGLVFAEDENGLVTYTDNTLGITATAAAAVLAGSGSEAAGWNGPLHLIVSTQENDRTLSAKDGDTKVTVRGALSKTTKASLSLDSSSDAASDSRSGKSGSEELLAVDITLSDKEAGQYEPDLPVTVTITDPAIREALQAGSKIEVYRVAGDGSRAADSVRETSDTVDEIAVDEESGTETAAESARNSGDSAPGLEKIEITDIDGSSVQFEAQGPLSYVIKIITASKKLTASDGSEYLVTVSYDTASGIPENAQLDVREIKAGEEGYDDYVAKSAKALGTVSENLNFARAFDISLTDPETGEKYQPAEDVKVSIQLLNQEIGEDEEIRVVHFEQKEGQGRKSGSSPRVMASSVKGETVEFETNGFSVYVVTGYTVDFHWGEYTYSIAGESEILLSALFEKLGVSEIALSDIADVSFSDPALVEVKKIEATDVQTEDWLLTSLAPFDTEETLTLTLKDGKSVEIRVTDEVEVDHNVYDNSNNIIGSWTLSSEGVMTITATGEMKDYSSGNYVGDTPWYRDGSMRSDIKKLIIANGENSITHIGTNSFTRAYALEEVDARNCVSLIDFGESIFKMSGTPSGTSKLEKIDFSGCSNLTTIKKDDFSTCNSLKYVDFSGCTSLSTIGNNAFYNCSKITYLDISGTQFTTTQLVTENTGFGKCKLKLNTLKANNCNSFTGTLNLSEYTALTTLELSGCTKLTSLTLPSSVTTLDISGCSKLDSLDLSTCTNLTTVKIGDRSDLTDLSWLTLPASVTTLDASGFTSLTSIDVPASVTTLDVSGCTGLTTLCMAHLCAHGQIGGVVLTVSGLHRGDAVQRKCYKYCDVF